MRELKIVGAGACALMAIGTLFSLLGGLQSGGAGSPSFLLGRIAGVLVLGALAAWLWRGSTRRNPPL